MARALRAVLPSDTRFISSAECDLSNKAAVQSLLKNLSATCIINAAAYTQVDQAESEQERAYAINAEAPRLLADFCFAHAIPLVHFSSDYVYSGEGENVWVESDVPAPQNVYGKSKLAGDNAIEQSGCDHLIFRTSWLYDEQGKNFFNTMLRLGKERETLNVVNDQFGAPTYVPHLAQAVFVALKNALEHDVFPSGIYHLCHQECTTWHGFANALFAAARHHEDFRVSTVNPILSSDYPVAAKRPRNSRLDCNKANSILHVTLPFWQQGLADAVEKKYASA